MMIFELIKFFLLILLVSFNLVAEVSPSKQKTYKLEDLKVLNNQGKYIELFEHLYDVIPSKRDQTWHIIFKQAISAYIKKSNFSEDDLEILYRLSINPDIKSKNLEKSLSDKLADELVSKLDSSKTKNAALIILKKYLEQKKFHFTKSFNIGEKFFKLGLDKPPYEFTWQLISEALNSNVSKMYCDQKVAVDLLKEKMSSINTLDNTSSIQILGKINKQCWEKFTASIYKGIDFKDEKKSQMYRILLSSGLQEQDKHYLSILYLLMSKKDKELTNISWNSLDHLKKHPEQRSKILKEIARLDPLPDTNFKGSDQATLSFINQLNTSFPEYVNYYLKTCYQYISGIKKFKMGNPTINCRDLVSKLSKEQINQNIYVKQIKKIFSF